eukprot:CAMPEP_0198127258 /NCGR_PEP_ID=MMETSP1442-20131203/46767_1 /TAXON_ID= /ORGANISM="Craspedostauros australis, Strain CCMP3328" /LENGTH=89 /DNA_ID=CAMNT_0043787203 /DNA_START=296 /DNA_END=565 /DNA_ORIENTATION=+
MKRVEGIHLPMMLSGVRPLHLRVIEWHRFPSRSSRPAPTGTGALKSKSPNLRRLHEIVSKIPSKASMEVMPKTSCRISNTLRSLQFASV